MTRVALLDHGYVELVESWGSDERVIEAARMSTGKGFIGWESIIIDEHGVEHVEEHECIPVVRHQLSKGLRVRLWDVERVNAGKKHVCADGCMAADDYSRRGFTSVEIKDVRAGDERLLKFLYENAHATPFEMAGAIIEVKAPIFVFREWHRHRTQSYNEMSARYTPLPDENYIPTIERLMLNSKTNKQAGTVKGAEELSTIRAESFQLSLRASYEAAEKLYQEALAMGVPKELARIHLPVGRYSRMRASANLRNWLAFMTLRSKPTAQWEIRQYSEALHDILMELFPHTIALFDEGFAKDTRQ